MRVYGPDDPTPDWMSAGLRQMHEAADARNEKINQTAVDVAKASLRPGQTLRERVAEIVCNGRHSGIDVWSMVKDQPDRAGHWLAWADALIAQESA